MCNLTINGGFLDNTSGAAVSLATNNLQSWNGDFTFLGTGGSTLNMGTGAVTLSADRTVTVSAGTFAVGGVIGGTYSLVKAGAGTLTLSGANTYSGGLAITAGQVNLNHSAAAGTGTLTISGGVIDNTSGSSNTLSNAAHIWNGDFTFVGSDNLNTGSGDITLNAGTVTVLANTLTIGGILGGSIGLTKAGPGRLYLDASATYAGPTVVDAGSLETSGDDFLPMGNDLTIGDAGTVTFASLQTIHSLSGSGKLFVGNTLTISNGSGNAFAGVLSGTGNVTLGSGTLTLGGANTYSGITTLDSGALLKLAHATALGGTAGYTDAFTYTSGSPLTLGAGPYTSTGEKGDHLVMMLAVGTSASGGITPSETLTVGWDEI